MKLLFLYNSKKKIVISPKKKQLDGGYEVSKKPQIDSNENEMFWLCECLIMMQR